MNKKASCSLQKTCNDVLKIKGDSINFFYWQIVFKELQNIFLGAVNTVQTIKQLACRTNIRYAESTSVSWLRPIYSLPSMSSLEFIELDYAFPVKPNSFNIFCKLK